MPGKILEGLAYAFSLFIALFLLLFCRVYQFSYLRDAPYYPLQYDEDSVFIGTFASLLLLGLYGVGMLAQLVGQRRSFGQLARSLGSYLTVFYSLSAGYYLYHFIKMP